MGKAGESPAVETRGGEAPDWANAKPGEELPEKIRNGAADWCGNPRCGGD